MIFMNKVSHSAREALVLVEHAKAPLEIIQEVNGLLISALQRLFLDDVTARTSTNN